MTTIIIPKKEYEELVDKRLRYDYLKALMEEDIFSPPSTRNKEIILQAFKNTKKYSQKFLRSLEKGLRRSSYFTP